MRQKSEFTRLRCQKCGRTVYLNPKVGVALLIEIEGHLMLVRRGEEPFPGWWTLPPGYVEYEESCEQAALREAQEELRTRVQLVGLHGVYSYQDDPRANMVLVVYRAICEKGNFSPGDDVSEVCLVDMHHLPADIAFSEVRRAISDYVGATQNGPC